MPKDTKTKTEMTAKNTNIQDRQGRVLKGEKSADAVVEKYNEMGFTDEIISEYFDIVEDHGQWYLDPKDEYTMNKDVKFSVINFHFLFINILLQLSFYTQSIYDFVI